VPTWSQIRTRDGFDLVRSWSRDSSSPEMQSPTKTVKKF